MKAWPGLTESERIAGVIATLRRGDEVDVRHFPGKIREAMADVVAYCDCGRWRIVSLSNPASIWRDLQGTRVNPERRDGTQRFGSGGDSMRLPEEQWLGYVGRNDLFDRAA